MWGNSRINKYLIISIIVLAVGIPTAYAITITLGADPIIVLGILDMMNNRIINVGTPTVSTDAATKGYVDSAVSTGTSGLQSQIDSNDVELADHENRISSLEDVNIENRIRDLELFHFTVPGPASITDATSSNGFITITLSGTSNTGGKPILDFIIELNGVIVDDGVSPDTTSVIPGTVGTLRAKAVNLIGEGPFGATFGCC